MKKNKSTRTRSRDDRKNSPFEDRKKFCPFSQKNSPIIDYKDVKLLSRYISEKGKITPSRISNVSSYKKSAFFRFNVIHSKSILDEDNINNQYKKTW